MPATIQVAEIKMSTQAKLGKDWVKAQVMLQETGETLHLTLPPGKTGAPVIAWIDGHMVSGRLELIPINNASRRGPDATVRLSFPELEKAPTTAPAEPVKPAVAPVPAAEPVGVAVSSEELPLETPSEEPPSNVENDSETTVQEPAPTTDAPVIKPAGEGRRKRRG